VTGEVDEILAFLCMMHSSAVCATCIAMHRSEPQWFGSQAC